MLVMSSDVIVPKKRVMYIELPEKDFITLTTFSEMNYRTRKAMAEFIIISHLKKVDEELAKNEY